jgi:hypothetical protein
VAPFPGRRQQEISMTKLRLVIAAALLTSAAFPALAVDTKPVTDQSATDATRPNTDQQAASTPAQDNAQTAMNSSGNSMGISSEPSATQRKGTHLNAKQRAKADADEAETTRQLNQQAAAMAAPNRTAMR